MGLVFVGEGAQRDASRSLAEGCKQRAISCLSSRRAKIPSVLAAGDVHVITVKRGPGRRRGAQQNVWNARRRKADPSRCAGRDGRACASARSRAAVSADPDDPEKLSRRFGGSCKDSATTAKHGRRPGRVASAYDRVKELQKFVKIIRGGRERVTYFETFWTGKLVLVTGGASFIGSTLADQLLARGAKVRVVDDLTSGHLGQHHGASSPRKNRIHPRGSARAGRYALGDAGRGHRLSSGRRSWRPRLRRPASGRSGLEFFPRRPGVRGSAATRKSKRWCSRPPAASIRIFCNRT